MKKKYKKGGKLYMKKPIIGITSAYEIEDGLRNYHRTTVSIDYSKSIIESGGVWPSSINQCIFRWNSFSRSKI